MLNSFAFCSSAENAAEEELRRENADHKDSGEFMFSADFFFSPCSRHTKTLLVRRQHVEDVQFVVLGTLFTQVILKGGIPSILFCVCVNDCNCGLNSLGESPHHCYYCCSGVAVVSLIIFLLSFFLFFS